MATETITQYRIRCDCAGCGKASGNHHDWRALLKQLVADGWDHTTPPGTVNTLYRCPACVKAGATPEGWAAEIRGT